MAKKKKQAAEQNAEQNASTPPGACQCARCGLRCRVASDRNPNAKMLRKSAVPKGLCATCAAHDWLRNTYPTNMILNESQHGPRILLSPSIREQFAEIMRGQNADAKPDEINWNLMIENWDLPWPHGAAKDNPLNPYSEKYAAHRRERIEAERNMTDEDRARQKAIDELPMVLTSFDQVNVLEPGLGDSLRDCLKRIDAAEDAKTSAPDPAVPEAKEPPTPEPPATQKGLFDGD